MSAPTKSIDKYANLAILTVTESAANTLTFKKLETGIALTDKVAWLIARLEYFFVPYASVFNGDTDNSSFGLSGSNTWATPSMQEATIYDYNNAQRRDFGAAAAGSVELLPFVKDFSTLPGGGLLVPPVPLYLWAKSSGAAAAQQIDCRIHYTMVGLKTEEYWELIEARRPVIS